MKTSLASPEGARLLEQARHFELRFACEHCAHFDERLEVCGHGYPTAEHRQPLTTTAPRAIDEGESAGVLPARPPIDEGESAGVLTFCKEFELA